MKSNFHVSEGRPWPLGATVVDGGVNFALFSANATHVELCLFDELGRIEIAKIELPGHTDEVWHGYVEGLAAGALYGYRVHGLYDPVHGHRFNPHKLLFDPYARMIDGHFRWSNYLFGYRLDSQQKDLIMDTHDNAIYVPKSVVTDFSNWQTRSKKIVEKPYIPLSKTVLYETHVKGFTQLHLGVKGGDRGTFAAFTNRKVLDYIKSLGVTAIEFLPVHGFVDEKFLYDQGLSNYWGYNSLHFFMPHEGYLGSGDPYEFKHMVDVIHDAGLEVILDVVYNHTAEGNQLGPTLSFRGIDNASYYCLEAHDNRFYANDTGCGNTLNLKHPRVLQMVTDSLRFWAGEMGVDGFRFDLATVLGREAHGFDKGSGFFDSLRQDPVLAGCKMIAEPWDIGPGGYQLGNYPSGWQEWNDRYRDTVRRFWKGDSGILPEFARRIHGSSDIFEHSGRGVFASVNFITSHDGFTLNDLVSYNERHNFANKENNNDGHHANFSYNHGHEGETSDVVINALRERQKRNFLTTLFLSQGTPMLLAGDEFGRTQQGNNNAYCQDNEINWINWREISKSGQKLQNFVQNVLTLRQKFSLFTSKNYIHKAKEYCETECVSVRWINPQGNEMSEGDWKDKERKCVGWILEQRLGVNDSSNLKEELILILFNAGNNDVEFTLPSEESVTRWQRELTSEAADGLPSEKTVAKETNVTLAYKSIQVFSAKLK